MFTILELGWSRPMQVRVDISAFGLGLMTTLFLSLTLSHSMPLSLAPTGLRQLAMVSNSLTVTFRRVCSAAKTPWSHFLISFVHTSTKDM